MYGALVVERRLVGAGLIAVVFMGLAAAHLSAAVVVQRILADTDFLFEILIVQAVLLVIGALGMHLLVFEDMTYELRATNRQLESARQELTRAAITDPLTGCHNRRFLDQVIDRELQRHSRFKLPLSLLFIDVDRFKAVNDSLGHEAGDRVLKNVADFLTSHIRDADYVFRYGGDEFLVLITCRGGETRQKGERLKAAFARALDGQWLPNGIGLSWHDRSAGGNHRSRPAHPRGRPADVSGQAGAGVSAPLRRGSPSTPLPGGRSLPRPCPSAARRRQRGTSRLPSSRRPVRE